MSNNRKVTVLTKSKPFKNSCRVLVSLSALALVSFEAQANSCAVSASSLRDAKVQYAQQCTENRVDCDKIQGQWYCASVKLTGSPPQLTRLVEPAQQHSSVDQSAVVESQPAIESASAQIPAPVAPIARAEPASAACVDSDGDGWGWNGVASCRMADVAFSVTPTEAVIPTVSRATLPHNTARPSSRADNCAMLDSGDYHITELVTDVVLTAGQSNAAGHDTSYQPETNYQDRGNDRFIVWTSNNTWEVANPRTQIWHGNRDYPLSYHGAYNHPGFQIGRAITNADKCRVVALIATAAPGEPIDYWLYNKDSHVSYIRQKVVAGLNALPGKYKLDMIWWMQGESDNDQIVDRYYAKLNNLIHQFRGEPWFQNDGYFLANETRNSLYANKAIRQLDTDGNVFTASSRGENRSYDIFPTVSRESLTGVHFGAESLRKIGDIVADKYLQEYQPELGL